jgi:hypothetical protein
MIRINQDIGWSNSTMGMALSMEPRQAIRQAVRPVNQYLPPLRFGKALEVLGYISQE